MKTETMPDQTIIRLNQAVGKYCRLINGADLEGIPGRIRIHVHGVLDPVYDDGEWYLRIKDCGYGSSGIGFPAERVEDIFTQGSGIVEITLR